MIEFEENAKYGYGVRKSIVFYFYDMLDSKKIEVIENIIETFIEQFQVKFNKKMVIDEDRYRNIRGGWQKLFHKVFDDGDFAHHAHILDLLEVEEEQMPTHRAYMLLWVDYYLPSSIIFQCTQQTDWKQIYHFMEYVNEQIEVHFASAGYDIVDNPWKPAGGAYGVRSMKNSKILNSYITEWSNDGYILKEKSGICCPNIIQILNPDFCQRLDVNEINASTITNTEMAGKNLMIDILDRKDGEFDEPEQSELERRMDSLYQMLKPIVIEYERMVYLKPDAWEQRMHRFDNTEEMERSIKTERLEEKRMIHYPSKRDHWIVQEKNNDITQFLEHFNCPYTLFAKGTEAEVIEESYLKALAECKGKGWYPALVIADEDLMQMVTDYSDREQIIAECGNNGKEILNRRHDIEDIDMEEDEEIFHKKMGKQKDFSPINHFASFMLHGAMEEVVLFQIPVKNPWELIAWIPTGGWNECLNPKEMMAVAKYWYEQYGAVPAVFTNNILEFYLGKAVSSDAVTVLASEHVALCPARMSYGTKTHTISEIAACLLEEHIWTFWWD